MTKDSLTGYFYPNYQNVLIVCGVALKGETQLQLEMTFKSMEHAQVDSQ